MIGQNNRYRSKYRLRANPSTYVSIDCAEFVDGRIDRSRCPEPWVPRGVSRARYPAHDVARGRARTNAHARVVTRVTSHAARARALGLARERRRWARELTIDFDFSLAVRLELAVVRASVRDAWVPVRGGDGDDGER